MWFNPIMISLLRSPFYRLAGPGMMLITYTGRRSGKTFTTPINYAEAGGELLTTSFKARTWWRNLRGGAEVKVHLNGQDHRALCQVLEDENEVVPVLAEFLRQNPRLLRYYKIDTDAEGCPDLEEVQKIASDRVMVKTKLFIKQTNG